MMNIQNLGPKESVGVKLNEGICAALCLKPWFGSNWCFCNIAKSGYLKATVQKQNHKRSRPKLTSEASVCKYS